MLYSDVTNGVKNKATGYEKPVHIDRMKRRFRRDDIDSLKEDKYEEIEVIEVAEGSGKDRDPLEDDEPLYDAVNHSEISEEVELGRGRPQKRLPTKFSDYVL